MRSLGRHLSTGRPQRQRRVVGVHPCAGSAAIELLGPLVVELGLRLQRLLHLQPRLRLRQLRATRRGEGAAGDLLQHALRLFELPFCDEALRRKVTLLQRHERLAGHDVVALADMDLEDPPADARADLHRVGLDRPAPLHRRVGPTDPECHVGPERDGDNQ